MKVEIIILNFLYKDNLLAKAQLRYFFNLIIK